MAYDRAKIIDKLKKLRAKAENINDLGSEAEANSFTELISGLMAQHQVDEAELESQDLNEVDPIVRVNPDYSKHKVKIRSRKIPWLEDLAVLVAHGNYCRLLVREKNSYVTFVGRRSNAETAAEVYCKLVGVAESMADREYVDYFHKCKNDGHVERARGFRQSFLIGFCSRIGKRYQEYAKATAEYFASNKLAVVALKNARTAVNDWVNANIQGTADPISLNIENAAGYYKGNERANSVSMSGAKEVE